MALVNQLLLTDRTKDDSSNPHLLDANVNDCFADDDYIYIATDGGLSVLNRSSLSRAGYHQLNKKVTSVWASASYVYYATWGGGVYRVAKADINGDFSASATQFLHTGSTPSLPTDYLYKVRGYSDSAILIGHSKGVSFYNGSSVYDGYHLLADDFVDNNIGDDPAGWTVDETGGTVEVVQDPFDSDEKCVKLTRSSDTTAIEKTFTAASKVVAVVEATIASDSNTDADLILLKTSTATPLWVRVNDSGNFQYHDGSLFQTINLKYELWRKYRIAAVLDCAAGTVDIYIDGIKYVNGGSVSGASSVDTYRASPAANNKTIYVHSVYITDATSDTFWGGP
ncbi:MAG: hypothetical protein ACTSPX_05860, partial [Candidatus Thorarchaeota archaeon]